MTAHARQSKNGKRTRIPSLVRQYMAAIGSEGGKTDGKAKVRGDAEYYKRISRKAVLARKRKAAEKAKKRK